MALLTPFFLVAYITSVFELIWFDLNVLGLGDPKFRTSVDFYFPLWSAFYSPALITALVFLWRSQQQGWRLWRLAGMYITLILVALEISFALDTGWVVLLLELAILGLLFRKIQQVTDRLGHA
jgi:hypothetical protein